MADQPKDPLFTYHDNVDTDIIRVNKDSLLVRLQDSQRFFASTSSAWGWGTASLSLFLAGITAGTPLWRISPDMIRGASFVGGAVCASLAIRSVWLWYSQRNQFEPREIVKTLTRRKDSPVALIEAPKPTPIPKTRRRKQTVGTSNSGK